MNQLSRKWLLACLFISLLSGLVACSDDEGEDPTANTGTTTETSQTTPSTTGTAGTAGATTPTDTGGDAGGEDVEDDVETGDVDTPDVSDTSNEDVPDAQVTPVTVVSIDPEDGTRGVPVNAALRVIFAGDVDPQSLNFETLLITPAVSGAVSWDAQSSTVTLRSNTLLRENTEYTLTVTRGVLDLAGNPLDEEQSASFTTSDSTIPVGDTNVYEALGDRAEVEIEEGPEGRRTFTLSTTATLRDNLPEDKRAVFSEEPGQVVLRSGNDMFDALFAMAIHETRLCSVSSISDYAFNNGEGVSCECFETGEKWNYVWTRDTAYAVDLGLSFIDPIRSRNSLDFKLSALKGTGDGIQIVQDTGSGGSYPVSSDRVVWALGAWQVLKFLGGEERTAWRDRIYEAMVHTIEQDRRLVFDARDGLYRGEQSFLDWREQSYPSWTAQNTVHLAMSKSLSTNVGHGVLLLRAADLAQEKGLTEESTRYRAWSNDVFAAINAELWLEDMGGYSALKTTTLDPAPLHKLDLLGSSLAVLEGVPSPLRAATSVEQYPHTTMGPPVLWPQQPNIPIYHNRGLWPFVTAYSVLAAREVGNDAVFMHDLESLIRGAALNVSHMENFEFLTHRPWVDAGAESGPVVNSRRQLWSVAGYIGAIARGVFGFEASQTGVRFAPFVPASLRTSWFAQTDEVSLEGLSWRGRTLDVTLRLPAASGDALDGVLDIEAIRVNGESVAVGTWLEESDLNEGTNTIEIDLIASRDARASSVRVVEDTGDWRALWAPSEPNVVDVERTEDGLNRVTFNAGSENPEDVVFHIWRDGVEVATGLTETSWIDPDSQNAQAETFCYAVESVFTSSGNRSHHSEPFCAWVTTPNRAAIQVLSAYDFAVLGEAGWSETLGKKHYQDWGDPLDRIEIAAVRPNWSGRYWLQAEYSNGAGGISTGITASVKRVVVRDNETGEEVGSGSWVMPHLATWERWEQSSLVGVTLDASKTYTIDVYDDINMSYFEHFIPYTAGLGGGENVFNRVNISQVKLLPLGGTSALRSAGEAVALDGTEDLSDFADNAIATAGIPLGDAPERLGFSWDEDYVYIAVETSAFAADYTPFHLYFGDADGGAGSNMGLEYSNLQPNLPFEASRAISLRFLSDDGAASGPWNGVWSHTPDGWRQMKRLEPGVDVWTSQDRRVISVRLERAWLGDMQSMFMSGHVVNGALANEWKTTVPSTHTPWMESQTGYYVIDLSQEVSSFTWEER